jgi:glyoxylase-like metal-dependent hydrolase (beta-lactamase superfamily II)
MLRQSLLRTAFSALTVLGIVPVASAAEALKLEVYNPDDKSIFPYSSEIISGTTEAVLIDAQFQRNDAEAVVRRIQAGGKKLTTVYISHSDPDYYFGLDVINAAFPDAKIVATPQTVAAINASKDGKLAYWGPILKDKAPKALVVPEPLQGDTITLEGHKIQIVGLDGPTPDRTFVWIPDLKTVAGGVPVFGNMHLWVADTQTPESRQNWLKTLDRIDALNPKTVVPGHYLLDADGKAPTTPAVVNFNRDYLKAFEAQAAKAEDSAELIAAMKRLYPDIGGAVLLDLSAKVIKGEMKWPQ